MTLLRELIDIPKHVPKGDFALHLSEGILDPASTRGETGAVAMGPAGRYSSFGGVKSAM